MTDERGSMVQVMTENDDLKRRIQSLAENIVAVEQREHAALARIAAARRVCDVGQAKNANWNDLRVELIDALEGRALFDPNPQPEEG